MSDQQPLLTLREFSFTHAMGREPALRHISLEIRQGDFMVLCGASGSGKSTLLELLKSDIAPCGTARGKLETTLSAQETAIVFQNPEAQLFTTSVRSDLALPMENRALPAQLMRRRMAETVSFLGLEPLLHRAPEQLSGGEKQLVSLCAALMGQPKLLLLDEPAAQLDPIAARAFFDLLRRVHEELGVTVVLAEHRLDEAAVLANRLTLLEKGEICHAGAPEAVFQSIWRLEDARFKPFLPQAPFCSLALDAAAPPALTPAQLRERCQPLLPAGRETKPTAQEEQRPCGEKVLEFRDVCFSYEKGEQVLRNLRLSVHRGEIVCLLGGNGSGKSTLLKLAAGLETPRAGRVKRAKGLRIGYLPQSLQACFLADTLAQALRESRARGGSTLEEQSRLEEAFSLTALLERHPYDLSGGEQQRAAFASLLLRRPELLLLDEPTKGLDPAAKLFFGEMLRGLSKPVLLATHDVAFAARFADRCAMLFDGSIADAAEPHRFFQGSRYYTTAIGQALSPLGSDAILYEDVLKECGRKKQG